MIIWDNIAPSRKYTLYIQFVIMIQYIYCIFIRQKFRIYRFEPEIATKMLELIFMMGEETKTAIY